MASRPIAARGKSSAHGWSVDRLISAWTAAKQALAKASAEVESLEQAMRSRSDLTALASVLWNGSTPRTAVSSKASKTPNGRRTRSKGLANDTVLAALKAVSGKGKAKGVPPAVVGEKLGGAKPAHVRAALKRLRAAGSVKGDGHGRGAKYWLA